VESCGRVTKLYRAVQACCFADEVLFAHLIVLRYEFEVMKGPGVSLEGKELPLLCCCEWILKYVVKRGYRRCTVTVTNSGAKNGVRYERVSVAGGIHVLTYVRTLCSTFVFPMKDVACL